MRSYILPMPLPPPVTRTTLSLTLNMSWKSLIVVGRREWEAGAEVGRAGRDEWLQAFGEGSRSRYGVWDEGVLGNSDQATAGPHIRKSLSAVPGRA